ncbi:MAG TPA: helix-turn-helix domain-containing protein [Roseiarcus sp.]
MTDQLVRITMKGMLQALGDVEVGQSSQSPGARLLAALRHSPGALRRHELVEYIYGDDPDGGPLWAPTMITVTVHRLRKSGHKIMSGRRGPLGAGSRCGYELRD